MRKQEPRPLRDAARSFVGAILLGTPLAYTMETWWLGWTLPAGVLLALAVTGLAVIYVGVSHIGFRAGQPARSLGQHLDDFLELLATSVLASFLTLVLLGIIEVGTAPGEAIRVTLLLMVPSGLGAAIADRLLAGGPGTDRGHLESVAVFALGALFFLLPVAPTQEAELITAHAGPWRVLALVPATLAVMHLTFHVVGFHGESRRRAKGSFAEHLGTVATGYVLALAIVAALLAGLGHFVDANAPEAVQKTVVLGFIAAIGGSAARVVV